MDNNNITYVINDIETSSKPFDLNDFTMDEIYKKDEEIETTEMQEVLDDLRGSHTVQQDSLETLVDEFVNEVGEDDDSKPDTIPDPIVGGEDEPLQEEPTVEIAAEPLQEESTVEIASEPLQEEPTVEIASEPLPEEPTVEIAAEPLQEEPTVEIASEPLPEEPTVEIASEPLPEKPVTKETPKLVFIIPYRERHEQYKFFSKHMKWILEDKSENAYKILYIHQTDTRDFNRGALKNIGFLVVKQLFPNDYQNITLVFNDIDTMPLVKNLFDYETIKKTVKHFYGFEFALGGIVSILAGDFEAVNGFPNFWSWGYEDNMLQKRVQSQEMEIDRKQFYPIFDRNILLLHDGLSRTVNKKEFDRFKSDTDEGIRSIRDLDYTIDENGFVNVRTFETGVQPAPVQNKSYDLRSGPVPFPKPVGNRGNKRKPTMRMVM
jgi:hypothetical protein